MIFITSVAPHDIERQQIAIKSWERYNIPIVSVNASVDELNYLKPLFPNVVFFVGLRTVSCVSKHIFINDIIDAGFLYFEKTASIFILNSDIILDDINYVSTKFHRNRKINNELDWFEYLSQNSLIGFRRYDETPDGELKAWNQGYDGFILHRNFKDTIPESEFVLGQSFWDWWLPLVFMVNNHSTWTFDDIFLIHKVHPRKHTQEQWEYYFKLCKAAFLPYFEKDEILSKMFLNSINANSRICNNFDIVL